MLNYAYFLRIELNYLQITTINLKLGEVLLANMLIQFRNLIFVWHINRIDLYIDFDPKR